MSAESGEHLYTVEYLRHSLFKKTEYTQQEMTQAELRALLGQGMVSLLAARPVYKGTEWATRETGTEGTIDYVKEL